MLAKGTKVHLLLDGKPYAEGVIQASRKPLKNHLANYRAEVRERLKAQLDYYVTGDNFGTWQFEEDLEIIY